MVCPQWWRHKPDSIHSDLEKKITRLRSLVSEWMGCRGGGRKRDFLVPKKFLQNQASLADSVPAVRATPFLQFRSTRACTQVLFGDKNRTLFWAIKCCSNSIQVHRWCHMVIILRQGVSLRNCPTLRVSFFFLWHLSSKLATNLCLSTNSKPNLQFYLRISNLFISIQSVSEI